MKLKLTENISNLTGSIKSYVKLQVDIAKMTAMEKGTRISIIMMTMAITFVLGSMFLFFLMAGFVAWYGSVYNNYVTPILIILGFIVLLMILFIILRKSVITPKIIESFTEILFGDDDILINDDDEAVIVDDDNNY